MKAALVRSFDAPPQFSTFDPPKVLDGELSIQVAAAALTPLVKAKANGTHYSSVAEFPFVPGNDGVGRTADGRRVYFVTSRLPFGSMAEFTVAKEDTVVPVPDDLDDITAAAIANPGMSSWAALSVRAKLVPGETVLVHGATGSAGRMAIQIAKHLGAGRVIAVGRNEEILESLKEIGADECVSLSRPTSEIVRDYKSRVYPSGVDVILDYLWGTPAELLLNSLVSHGRAEGEPRVRCVQIGTAAGATIALPGATLRSSGLEIMGSGFGSVSQADLLTGIAGLFAMATPSGVRLETEVVPIEDVQEAWTLNTQDRRIVFWL